jgi:ADP-heptose:LPS heptosyltransferase
MDLALTSEELQQARLFIAAVMQDKPFIVCSIGTKLAVNDWGQDHWKEFIKTLSASYRDYGLIFIGVQEEYERSDELLKSWQGARLNLCGKLTVRESAAVLSISRLFVGHDSGPMHLAAATGITCVAIFSRRNKPGWWFPFGTQHKNIYTQGDSIRDISVDEVMAAVNSVLQSRAQ